MSRSAISLAVAVFLVAASASAQIVEPSKVVPPPAQKTTVSGTLSTVTPTQTQRQQNQQTVAEVLSPLPPTEVKYGSTEVTSLSLRPSSATKELPLPLEFTPWLSTPSVNWFMLTSKDSPKSWEPAPSVKDASFDTAPSASPTHSWDDNPDPRLKGSKVDWK